MITRRYTDLQKFLIVVTVGILSIGARGIALSILWLWFVALPFKAPAIGWMHAQGLALLLSVALEPKRDDLDVDSLLGLYAAAVGYPLGYIALGWVFAQLGGLL